MSKKHEDNKIKKNHSDFLDKKEDYDTTDLVNYLSELDNELQRLVRNLLKIRTKTNPARAALKESPAAIEPDNHLTQVLSLNGIIVEDGFGIVNGVPYKIVENTFSYLSRHGIFKERHVILIVSDYVNAGNILKAAYPDSIIFIRHSNSDVERIR